MASTQVTTRILRRLLASGVTSRAERLLVRMHPADLAPLLGALDAEEIRTVVDMLFRHHRAAQTLRELPIEMLPQIFEVLADERLAQVIARLEVDDMVELIEAIPEERRPDVVALIPQSRREELRKVQLYPESSAGRVMTTIASARSATTPSRSSTSTSWTTSVACSASCRFGASSRPNRTDPVAS
jgi:magnesium transporter